MSKKPIKIIITGDLVVTDNFRDKNLLDSSIKKLFEDSDCRITNLEAPVIGDNPKFKINKTGPHLQTSPETIAPILNSLNVDLVTLANNHILDYGPEGLLNTLAFCDSNKTETVGAGINVKEASNTWRKTIKGHKIAVINFAENEWASATESEAGANPLDIIDNINQIKKEKKNSDKVFVIIHGGHEYYHLPSPRMQKQYRFYAENGADVVVGHHTHCLGGYEIHGGVPIYYSLGNFLFTKKSQYKGWYQGLCLEVNISDEGKIEAYLHPVEQNQNTYYLQLLEDKKKEEVLTKIRDINKIIASDQDLTNEWIKFIESNYVNYLKYFSPVSFLKNQLLKRILMKVGFYVFFLNKQGLSLLLNLFRCEAHSDLSKAVIKKYLNKG